MQRVYCEQSVSIRKVRDSSLEEGDQSSGMCVVIHALALLGMQLRISDLVILRYTYVYSSPEELKPS